MKMLPSAPYTHANSSVTRTMTLVMLALSPATLLGLYQFGWPAIFLFVTTIATAIVAEALCLMIAKKPVRLHLADGSAILSAWIVALTLPPWAPWWIGVSGALIAIVIGKQIFGGIGQNVFNPAMVARVMLLVSFPLEMTRFVNARPLFSDAAPGFIEGLRIFLASGVNYDALSSPSVLGFVRMEISRGLPLSEVLDKAYNPLSLFLGTANGSMGEVSALLILLGGLFLVYKRIITWHTPASMIAAMILLAGIFHLISPEKYPDPIYQLLTGAFMLGAFFIATDYVTVPSTRTGRMIFGAGCGALVFVIRSWAAFPEGVAFSILLMNALTPVIDYYVKPRIYGRTRKGEPLDPPERS